MSNNYVKLGDRHCFGKCVSKVSQFRNTKAYFHKPRPVYLEYLFLSSESPISDYLDKYYDDRPKFEIISESNLSGWSEDQNLIDSSLGTKNLNTRTLAYWAMISLFFGISDLHPNNFGLINVGEETHFTVFDIETAFENINGLISTNLLPSRIHVTENRAPIYLYPTFSISELFDDLIEIYLLMNTDKENLISIVWSYLQNYPVRFILRDTQFYRACLDNKNKAEEHLINEEIFQINYNDIPYFFRYLESNNLYYFKSPKSSTKVESISIFQPTTKEFFLKRDLLVQLKISLLQLSRHFLVGDQILMTGKHFSLHKKNNSVEICFLNNKICYR